VDLLKFKRRVTLGFLYQSLNSGRTVAGRAGHLIQRVLPSPALGPKHGRMRLSVREEINFNSVGLHHPIFGDTRGRCQGCQDTTEVKHWPAFSLVVASVNSFSVCPRREIVS